MKQTELGKKAFGKVDNTAIQSLKKGSSPAFDRVAAMASALGLEFYLGPPRESGHLEEITLDGSDYALIPMHDAALSAGPGADNDGANVTGHLAFSRDWLKRINVLPTDACLARVTGDSMAPGLPAGAIVLINTARKDIVVKRRAQGGNPPPIFAFIQAGEARVKRIERPEAQLLILLSDNPAFPPETIGSPALVNFAVLGQVVWSGHVWR